ncbi:hypothetical protein PT2222_270029 [Paraburkholderia tropica]
MVVWRVSESVVARAGVSGRCRAQAARRPVHENFWFTKTV